MLLRGTCAHSFAAAAPCRLMSFRPGVGTPASGLSFHEKALPATGTSQTRPGFTSSIAANGKVRKAVKRGNSGSSIYGPRHRHNSPPLPHLNIGTGRLRGAASLSGIRGRKRTCGEPCPRYSYHGFANVHGRRRGASIAELAPSHAARPAFCSRLYCRSARSLPPARCACLADVCQSCCDFGGKLRRDTKDAFGNNPKRKSDFTVLSLNFSFKCSL